MEGDSFTFTSQSFAEAPMKRATRSRKSLNRPPAGAFEEGQYYWLHRGEHGKFGQMWGLSEFDLDPLASIGDLQREFATKHGPPSMDPSHVRLASGDRPCRDPSELLKDLEHPIQLKVHFRDVQGRGGLSVTVIVLRDCKLWPADQPYKLEGSQERTLIRCSLTSSVGLNATQSVFTIWDRLEDWDPRLTPDRFQ